MKKDKVDVVEVEDLDPVRDVTVRKNGSRRVGVKFPGGTRVKQHFKKECDINEIVKRHKTQGVITHLNPNKPLFGDFSELMSYEESLGVVMAAEEKFASLSAGVRERFGNDPGLFVKFMSDNKNIDEAVKLGLARKVDVETERVVSQKDIKELTNAVKASKKEQKNERPE